MKAILSLIILSCSFSCLYGQLNFGGSVGYSKNFDHPDFGSSIPGGLFTQVELKKAFGRYAFGFDYHQIKYSKVEETNALHKIITIPFKLNFDYTFFHNNKFSPYLSAGVGLAHIKLLSLRESQLRGSNCYSFKIGTLIKTKIGDLNLSANYIYLPNEIHVYNRGLFIKYPSYIFNFGIGLMVPIISD